MGLNISLASLMLGEAEKRQERLSLGPPRTLPSGHVAYSFFFLAGFKLRGGEFPSFYQ